MKPSDQEQLLQRFVDGELDDEGCRQALALIKSDPTALALYCDYAELDAWMGCLTSGPACSWENTARLTEENRRQHLRRIRRAAFAAAAAALIVIGLILTQFLIPETPVLTFRTSPDTHFVVTHREESGRIPAPDALEVGSRLKLRQGSVEFTFDSGGRSIIQAPADLTLLSEDSLRFDEGKGWFHVPQKAVGFRVRTPELELVDLGTQFGVISHPDMHDEVHVFDGSVEITALIGRKENTVLKAGKACEIDPIGRLLDTAARPEAFLTALPDTLPSIQFAFDSIEGGGKVKVTGSHSDAGSIEARLISDDPASRLVSGVAGNALSLDGKGDWIETDWPGFPGDTPRSVAFWFRIPPGAHSSRGYPATVAWGGPLENTTNGKWKIWFTRYDGGGELLPGISFGAERYHADIQAVDDGQWHHLVAIYTGQTLEDGAPECLLYLDGKRTPLTHRFGPEGPPANREVHTLTEGPRAHTMRIGFGLSTKLPTLDATLDELRIYKGVISEATILKLHETGSTR